MDRVARFEAVDERDGETLHRDVAVALLVGDEFACGGLLLAHPEGAELHAAFDELQEWGQKWIDEE